MLNNKLRACTPRHGRCSPFGSAVADEAWADAWADEAAGDVGLPVLPLAAPDATEPLACDCDADPGKMAFR